MTEAMPATVVKDYTGLVAALNDAKNHLGLSNEFCEEIGDLTAGQIDKWIGPSLAKSFMTPFAFNMFCELFAVEFVMRPNPQAIERMQSRWERRNHNRIRVSSKPLSLAVKERAKSEIFAELGRRGGLARARSITSAQRSAIARKASLSRRRVPRQKKEKAR
jgi:hypothetical protein